MRTEQEIRDELAFWQGMLGASRIAVMADQAEFLIKLPSFQGNALERLKTSLECRQHEARLREKSLSVIIDTLKWALEEH